MLYRHLVFASAGLAVIASVAACAGTSDYVYRPDSANATEAGLPAARTAIPQERPQGAIEVTSYGITELQRGDARIAALHVRAVVTNDGDNTPWTLDTTQQLVAIPGEGQSRAMFVNSDVNTVPNVTIARHERRVLDFYFPLPDTIRSESQLPKFELLWQVNTAERVVASRTSFDRFDKAPDVAYARVPVGWPLWAGYGPYWWYDPFYPRAVFIHSRPIIIQGRDRVRVGRFDGRFRPSTRAPVVTRRR
jgi:hypothetical protein